MSIDQRAALAVMTAVFAKPEHRITRRELRRALRSCDPVRAVEALAARGEARRAAWWRRREAEIEAERERCPFFSTLVGSFRP